MYSSTDRRTGHAKEPPCDGSRRRATAQPTALRLMIYRELRFGGWGIGGGGGGGGRGSAVGGGGAAIVLGGGFALAVAP
jgi:hypothetical protein